MYYKRFEQSKRIETDVVNHYTKHLKMTFQFNKAFYWTV